LHVQGRRSCGRARGAVKQLRAMEIIKNKKIVTNCVCFCSSTMLTSKIYRNRSEFIEKNL